MKIDTSIELADLTQPGHDIWIIGGGEIYNHCLEEGYVTEIYASEIKGDYEGDATFPELDGWTGEVVKSFEKFDVVKYTKTSSE